MKQLEVEIMGQRYLLSCPEGGEVALLKAAHRVDTAMCKIRGAGKVKARDRIAVLASLNLAFELCEAIDAQASSPVVAATEVATTTDAQELENDVALKHLLHRLDQALMDDSRLI